MERTLPAPTDWRRWLLAAAVVLVTVLVVPWWLAQAQSYIGHAQTFILGVDWRTFEQMAAFDNPYSQPFYRWSPVAAWIMALLVPLGFYVWTALHVMALMFLRSWWMIAAFMLAPPFWDDVVKGNSMAFVAVAGVLAMRGSRAGIVATYALALLMPRPVALPLVVYLLWTEPWSRRWMLWLFVAHGVASLASGHAADYIVRLATTGPSEMARPELPDWPPIDIFGAWWLPIGAALAVALTRLGFPGLAGIALAPYWIGNYGMMALVDLRRLANEAIGHRAGQPR